MRGAANSDRSAGTVVSFDGPSFVRSLQVQCEHCRQLWREAGTKCWKRRHYRQGETPSDLAEHYSIELVESGQCDKLLT